jgi:hypothetical protein
MDSPAPYIHWGFFLISLPNFILIVVMLLVFIGAILAPFPHHGHGRGRSEGD